VKTPHFLYLFLFQVLYTYYFFYHFNQNDPLLKGTLLFSVLDVTISGLKKLTVY